MSKVTSKFVCQSCGAISAKWIGQCEVCKSWNTMIEEVHDTPRHKTQVPSDFFKTVSNSCDDYVRNTTVFEELNRALGGGFVSGEVVLIGGSPGIGKSTLLLQILLNKISCIDTYLYISAEESVTQVSMRAKRIGVDNQQLLIAATSSLEQICAALEKSCEHSIVVIDSIQTIFSSLIQSPPGSISQVRYCTQELINIAKKKGIIILIVGHITKDGEISGPKTLEHMVDCVLYFEGEKAYDYRVLRCVKNRFGPTDEIGVFSMESDGLHEVQNPSAFFLSEHNENVSGVSVFAGIEGTRPILSEIQALVSYTNVAIPKRSSIGFDSNRLAMLVAVLSSRCRLSFANRDVYLNVAGGLRIVEPAIDLAVIAAIISAYKQKPLSAGSVFFGEISLSGEVRQSHCAYIRAKEAKKLGFSEIYCSYKTEDFDNQIDIGITKIKNIIDFNKNI